MPPYKTSVFRVIAVIIGLLALSFVFIACSSGDDDNDENERPTVRSLPSVTPINSPLPGVSSPTAIAGQPPLSGPSPTAFTGFPSSGGVAPTLPSRLPENMQIVSPIVGSAIRGNVSIFGSASHPDFVQYALEFGPDPNPGGLYYPITPQAITQPVINNVLSAWNTGTVPDGLYQIRLHVYLTGGRQITNVLVNGLRVSNVGGPGSGGGPASGGANQNPVISPVAPLNLRNGLSTTVALGVYDPDYDEFTINASTDNPTVVTVAPVGQAITLTALAPGIATITVRVVDAFGGTAETSFLVTVASTPSTNSPPNIAGVPNQTMVQNTAVNIPLTITDANNDTFDFTVSSSLPGVVAATRGPGQSINLTANAAGTANVSVVATDGRQASNSIIFSVVVNPAAATNNSPSIGAISAQTLDVNQSKDIALSISDPDNDPMTFTVTSSAPAIVTAVSVNNTTLRIAGISAGTVTVTVAVSDNRGGSNSTVFSVTVNTPPPANRPPVIAVVSDQTIEVGQVQQIDLTFSDADGDPITFAVASSDPAIVTTAAVDNDSFSLTGVAQGQSKITVSIGDGRGGSASISFNVLVNPATIPNQSPILDNIAPQALTAGQTALVPLSYSDPDGDPIGVLAATDNAAVVTVFQSTERELTIIGVGTGVANVNVTISDGRGGSAVRSFVVTVTGANQNPQIAPVDPQNCEVGQTLTIVLNYGDVDGDPVTLSAQSSAPDIAQVTISGNNPLTITCLGGGNAAITVNATDGREGVGTITFNVSVGTPNQNPEIAPLAPQTCAVGDTLTIGLTFSDPDGDAVNISPISSAPDIAQVSLNIEGTLSLICLNTGDATITIAASDTRGGTANTAFNVSVIASATATETATTEFTPTPTDTPSETPTLEFTASETATTEFTPTATETPSPTETETATPTETVTTEFTPTPTDTPSETPTLEATSTETATATPTDTPSETPTLEFTATETATTEFTPTATETFTETPSPTVTETETATLEPTATETETPTETATVEPSATPSETPTETPTSTEIPNQIPAIAPIETQTCEVGEALVVIYSATDPDNDFLTTTATSSDLTIANVNVIDSFSLGVECLAAGSTSITVTVNDGRGGEAATGFSVEVVAANQPPTISSVDPQNCEIGQTLPVTIAVNDADNDPLTVSALSDNEAVAQVTVVDNATLSVTCLSDGFATISVGVEDGREGSNATAFTVNVTFPNQVPVIGPIEAQTCESGQPLIVNYTANDPDNDLLTTIASSSDTGIAIAEVPDAFSIAVQCLSPGSATITVSTDDGQGGTTSTDFTVTVSLPNQIPTIENILPQTCEAGQTITVAYLAFDPDGTPVTVTASSDNPSIVVSPADANNLNVECLAAGTANITLAADDGLGGTATTTFTVEATAPNQAPTINPIDPQTCQIGETLTVFISVADLDNDALSVSALSDNDGIASVTVLDNATLSVICNSSGLATISVGVDDGRGGSNAGVFTVEVAAPNQAPTINPIDPQTCQVGETLTVFISVADLDNDALSVSALSDNDGIASVTVLDNATLSVICNSSGLATISVGVDDGRGGSNAAVFTVDVAAPNQSPTINPIDPQTCQVGETLTVFISVADADNDALTVSALSDNDGIASVTVLDNATLSVICNSSGVATISVGAEDGRGGSNAAVFTVEVAAANQIPTLAPIDPQICEIGQTLPVLISASDPDGDVVTVTAFSNNDAVAQASAADAFTVTVTCNSAGTATITVGVDDGRGGTTEGFFDVTVNAPAVVTLPFFDINAYPALPDISTSSPTYNDLLAVYQNGVFNLGRRNTVFAVAGDESLGDTDFLDDIALGSYDLGSFQDLQNIVNHYSLQPAHDVLGDTATSFNVTSAATGEGWTIENLLDPTYADPTNCAPGETPLDCELRLSNPSVLFVSFTPTNATATSIDTFSADLQQIVDTALASGVIPILVTLPDDGTVGFDTLNQYNEAIATIATNSNVPLWNLYLTMQEAPNGVYTVGGFGPMDLSDAALTSGVNRRNLHALFILESLRQTFFQ